MWVGVKEGGEVGRVSVWEWLGKCWWNWVWRVVVCFCVFCGFGFFEGGGVVVFFVVLGMMKVVW